MKPISSEIIYNNWDKIVNVLKSKYPRVYNGVKTPNFDLHEEQIVLHVKSEQLKKSIDDRLALLTKQAQLILDNRKVKFVLEIKETPKEKKSLYLVKDKYNHYLEKNKNIEKLTQIFNLDL